MSECGGSFQCRTGSALISPSHGETLDPAVNLRLNAGQRNVVRTFGGMDWISKAATVVVAVSVAYALLRKLRRSSISDIRGPDNSASFLLGSSTSLCFVRLALTERAP